MIDSTHGVPLLRRAVAEHRRLVVAIGVALAANLLVYILVVYPLASGSRTSSSATRRRHWRWRRHAPNIPRRPAR